MFLVDVKIYVETLEYRPSSKLFHGTVNKEFIPSQPHCEGILTKGRGFFEGNK